MCAHAYVCMCVLKSNDEHHPGRYQGKTELPVNWNCHIHSIAAPQTKADAPSRHTRYLALNCLFYGDDEAVH